MTTLNEPTVSGLKIQGFSTEENPGTVEVLRYMPLVRFLYLLELEAMWFSRLGALQDEYEGTNPKGPRALLITFAIICLIVGFIDFSIGNKALFVADSHADAHPLANLASFGSYLQGTTAAFWALAGVCLIFVAFLAQMMQLRLQQQDLEEQQERLEKQEVMTNRQNFESSFFQLLNLHNQIVTTMRGRGIFDNKEYLGRACFEQWFNDSKRIHFTEANGEPRRVSSVGRYMWLYNGRQGELGHYFRNLYHVIKFVKESETLKDGDSDTEYKNRRRYTSLVRATLSQFELALLFYNGLSDNGEKFKPLIEEFGLLENFDRDALYDRQEDEKLYKPKAFE